MDILKSLDILLSLTVVYLIIAATLSSRARWLRTDIAGQLAGTGITPGQVYASPFVSALANASGSGKAFDPSDLQAWTLVQDVLDAWYRQKTQYVLFFLAVVLAGAVNLDDRLASAGLPLGWSRVDPATMGALDWLGKLLGIGLDALKQAEVVK